MWVCTRVSQSPDMDKASPEGPGRMRALAENPGSLGPTLSGPSTSLGGWGWGWGLGIDCSVHRSCCVVVVGGPQAWGLGPGWPGSLGKIQLGPPGWELSVPGRDLERLNPMGSPQR